MAKVIIHVEVPASVLKALWSEIPNQSTCIDVRLSADALTLKVKRGIDLEPLLVFLGWKDKMCEYRIRHTCPQHGEDCS